MFKILTRMSVVDNLSYEQKVKKALSGDMDFHYPEKVKIVRIFTSSTFTVTIAASEFEKLLGAVDNQDDLQLLKNWFWRDDNSVPAQYLLQPITSLLPGYRDYANDESRKKRLLNGGKRLRECRLF
ncbi:hypothetical protein OS493_039209 [Desmophyllum pertusum]|uniref:Uncharacterized protein n=1 Tax=Desmophyllum pertusum TaxID=174260 RepID=A0A9W9Z6B2_9CNID|nr:hypothetical protein OS493_039209 [Desmophyllum pertusum]